MDKIRQRLIDIREKSQITDMAKVKELDLIGRLDRALANHKTGVGLSAIQIGEPYRVAIVRNESTKLNMINPEIVGQNDKGIILTEMCLSLPGLEVQTLRYQEVTVKWLDEAGAEHTQTFKDFESAVIQHEIDHMDGITILDRRYKVTPYKREKPKIGRNDPCPCGSGKKFKKCCGYNL